MKNQLLLVLFAIIIVVVSVNNSAAIIDSGAAIGIWLLDEGNGNTVKDSSGNGNDGKIVGAKWTDGKFGKALDFNGSAKVEIPPSESIDDFREEFTYLLWVKPTAAPPNVNTRVIERDWHNPTIQIGPADFYGSIAVNGDQAQTHVRGGSWEQDEWSFVAITYDGNVLKLFVDGEFVGEKAVGVPDNKPNGDIRLASWKDPGWTYIGLIDDVGIFNIPLSEDDLLQVMDNGLEEALEVIAVGKLTTTWGLIKFDR